MKTMVAVISFLILGTPARAYSPDPVRIVHPDSALARLQSGNARHVAGTPAQVRPVAELRREIAHGQHPVAVVVGCSDSRTAPEILFDQNLGDLFVVRTAGNLAGDHAWGSIEYAVEHLGTRLIVVMGHQRCGAVTAAMGAKSAPGHVGSIVREIRPATVSAATAVGGDALARAVRENARRVAAVIRDRAELGEARAGVRVVTAYYDLETGAVAWDPD
jgi:carbonic anhydrase